MYVKKLIGQKCYLSPIRQEDNFSIAKAFVVKDDKVVESGTSQNILAKYQTKQIFDADGKAIYPGFEDVHCHFVRYGLSLHNVDLVNTKSYQEILDKLQEFHQTNPNLRWLIGRGWDQNDWEIKNFPNKTPLDSLFPDIPVYLTCIDGHATLVNQKALEVVGITPKTTISEGGKIEIKDGQLTGILVDEEV